jgi:ribonuclease HII
MPEPSAMRWVLGLDEAGRGSVLGPLVVGGWAIPLDQVPDLRPMGVRDSKALSPAKREGLYETLRTIGRARTIHLEPIRIDPSVGRGGLNQLEAEAFAELIRAFAPDEVRVDACDPNAARFGRTVRRLSGTNAPVRSRHKADRDDPVVGAASIIAKVERDRAIARLERDLALPIGSGYPSDATTMRFLKGWIDAHPRERPTWLRYSWAPTRKLLGLQASHRLEEFGP